MKPLRYFFFRLYHLNLKHRSAVPWFRALALMSVLTGANVLVITAASWHLWGGEATGAPLGSVMQTTALLWCAFFFVVLYSRWIKGGRYLEFKKEFGAESAAQRKVRTVLLFAYAIATLCTPAIVGRWMFLQTR